MNWRAWALALLVLLLVGRVTDRKPVQASNRSISTIEDREWLSQSSGFAPHPEAYQDAVIQVYAARTWGAKQALAVHSWIATKKTGSDHYVVRQVIGWRQGRYGTVLFSEPGIPDRSWWGHEPALLLDRRGEDYDHLIDRIDQATATYPWSNHYRVWPGPNSNTYIAWLGLQVPELGLDLPSTAIGKDWRPWDRVIGLSASGTGLQTSIWGLAGATVGYEEGFEINLLGLSFELDLFDMAIELPLVGRIGPDVAQ